VGEHGSQKKPKDPTLMKTQLVARGNVEHKKNIAKFKVIDLG